MPVNLSIKNVPDNVAERLRARARQNHRSMQGEIMAILELVAESDHIEKNGGFAMHEDHRRLFRAEPRRKLTVEEVVEKVRRLGLENRDEAMQMIREDRDR